MSTHRAGLAPALLSFVEGYVDTVGFIALFSLFTAHVTGNFVLVGASLGSIAGGGLSAGLIGKLLALPVFVVGVWVTAAVLRNTLVEQEKGPRLALLMQAAGIVLFMAAGVLAQPVTDPDAPFALLCGMLGVLAMSVQNASSRLVFTDMAPSTVMTGNVTQLVIDSLDLYSSKNPEISMAARRRIGKILPPLLAFAVGAISGGIGYHFFGFFSLLAAIGALLLALLTQPAHG